MKKQQILTVSLAALLLLGVYFFANKKGAQKTVPQTAANTAVPTLSTQDILKDAKKHATPEQLAQIEILEKQLANSQTPSEKIGIFSALSTFWGQEVHNQYLGAYYLAEKAKLENSEKSLNFAANSFLSGLLIEQNPILQNWMAVQAKELYDRSLQLNTNNDSTHIGIGACYMFGNISTNPMEGVTKVREIADKNPHNTFAQLILGLGGVKSGQLDNAKNRFLHVVEHEPTNMLAIFNLAEINEKQQNKEEAIKWYSKAKELVQIEELKKEIDQRINQLK